MRRLKAVQNMLRSNIAFKKEKRRKALESDLHYKHSMLLKFFSVFKEEDALSKARESCLVTHLVKKRKALLN